MKSEYRDKLLQEYKNYGLQPVTVKLNNEELIIPAEYAVGKEKEDAQKSFFRDYFDLQKKELKLYKDAGIKPQTVEMNRVSYIVPFKWREKKYKDTKVVEFVLKKAKAKYNRAIALTCKLDKAYPKRKYTVEIDAEHVEDMQKAYNRYVLNKCVDKSKYAVLKAAEMIVSSVRSMRGKKSAFNISKLQRNLKHVTIGSLIVGGAVVSGYGFLSTRQNVQPKDNQPSKDKAEIKISQKNQVAETSETAVKFEEAQKRISQKSHEAKAEKLSVKQNKNKEEAKEQTKENKPETLQKVKTANIKRSDAAKTKLFNKFMAEIFESEGGYGDEKTIDQPTNMGIIKPTLKAFIERYPDLAKANHISTDLKKLKRSQAKLIYQKLYFEQYQIGDYKNESIGLLIFDIYVNHEPNTAKKFIDQALKAARKTGVELNLPISTKQRVNVVNSLADYPEAEAAFYKQMMKERKFHMYKVTGKWSSRFADGLKNRANKYDKRYVPTIRQNTMLAMNSKNAKQK